MRKPPATNQWMLSLLVHGFSSPRADSPSDKVRVFRHERLRRMALNSVYGDPDDPDYRSRSGGTRSV